MSDLAASTDSGTTNISEFSVSEISNSLKRMVEDAFGRVRIRGEISGYRGPHSSGHAYFSLKDDRAKIDAVVWRGAFSKLDFKPEEGLEVIATGKLTTYPGSSKYQIVIDNIEPAGAGALMALLEERRKKLAAEGLFDAERKKQLPFLPKVIGVVTSPTGSVIRDILHRLNDRFPIHVVVWPVRVQGETAAEEVARAIEGFGGFEPRPDLLIVARGGGSLEDLWSFNEEVVVRAAAASAIPLISAIGHETDTTLIDHVSDKRAPTPTAAAEIAVPVKSDLEAYAAQTAARLNAAVARLRDQRRDSLRAATRGLPQPDALLALPRQRFDATQTLLPRGLENHVQGKRARLSTLSAQLSPTRLALGAKNTRARFERSASMLPNTLGRMIENMRRDVQHRASRLKVDSIAKMTVDGKRSLSTSLARLDRAISVDFENRRASLIGKTNLLSSLSYERVLARGFALVRDADGNAVSRAADTRPGQRLSVEFGHREQIDVVVEGQKGKAKAASSKKRAQTKKDNQGSLF